MSGGLTGTPGVADAGSDPASYAKDQALLQDSAAHFHIFNDGYIAHAGHKRVSDALDALCSVRPRRCDCSLCVCLCVCACALCSVLRRRRGC